MTNNVNCYCIRHSFLVSSHFLPKTFLTEALTLKKNNGAQNKRKLQRSTKTAPIKTRQFKWHLKTFSQEGAEKENATTSF